MQQVKNRYPDDLDGAALFAESGLNLNPWNQWTKQGEPRPGTLELVAVLESVLKGIPTTWALTTITFTLSRLPIILKGL
jgi:hypothetical protein